MIDNIDLDQLIEEYNMNPYETKSKIDEIINYLLDNCTLGVYSNVELIKICKFIKTIYDSTPTKMIDEEKIIKAI